MKQGTAYLAEDYCFIHKALRPVSKARRQIAAVPPSNSRPAIYVLGIVLLDTVSVFAGNRCACSRGCTYYFVLLVV